MKEELKIFENRSDDWLAKQRAYEDRHSVWNLDDGKNLKEEHHRIHEEKDIRKQNFKNIEKNRRIYTRINETEKQKSSKLLIIFIYFIIFLVVMIDVGIFGEIFAFMPIIIFVIIMASFTNLKKGKR